MRRTAARFLATLALARAAEPEVQSYAKAPQSYAKAPQSDSSAPSYAQLIELVRRQGETLEKQGRELAALRRDLERRVPNPPRGEATRNGRSVEVEASPGRQLTSMVNFTQCAATASHSRTQA